MPQTPFQIYYMARMLENLPDEDRFVPVFASSDIKSISFSSCGGQFGTPFSLSDRRNTL